MFGCNVFGRKALLLECRQLKNLSEQKLINAKPQKIFFDQKLKDVANQMIIFGQGQTVLLDTDTAVLSMLLIKGGELIFDDEKEVTLNAQNILITEGGLLQVIE